MQKTSGENFTPAPIDTGAALLPLLQQCLLGDLTASLLHDLNNPITAILNYARLLQMSPFQPEEIAEFARSIAAEGERMAEMTGRARVLALEAQGAAKLDEALALALELNKTRFRHGGIAVEIPQAPNLPNTKLSLAQLLQLILPILEQAHRALSALPPEAEKKLCCLLTATAGQQRLTISHNGIDRPEATANFLGALFPQPPQPEQLSVAEAMTRALLAQLDCSATLAPSADGWVILHLDLPAEM